MDTIASIDNCFDGSIVVSSGATVALNSLPIEASSSDGAPIHPYQSALLINDDDGSAFREDGGVQCRLEMPTENCDNNYESLLPVSKAFFIHLIFRVNRILVPILVFLSTIIHI